MYLIANRPGHPYRPLSPSLLPIFANGDSLTFVGPKPHSVVSLKTPVAQMGGSLLFEFINFEF